MFLFKGKTKIRVTMKLLSRTEEFILLAVYYLKEDAYAVRIRKHLKEITSKSWSYGALFTSLEQMVRKGYLKSYLTEPLAVRGGRSKRIYKRNMCLMIF